MPGVEKCRAFLFYYLQKPYFRKKVFRDEERLSIISSIRPIVSASVEKSKDWGMIPSIYMVRTECMTAWIH